MKPYILIANDDGIQSPGLAAVADVLDPLGDLLIVAPNKQQTSMGRSRTNISGGDGTIERTSVHYGDASWDGFSVKASPALAVTYAVNELAERPITLAISGINFGENVATCVTVSGTIGAALEAADYGIPTLAVSQEIANLDYHSYNSEIDFSTAAHFTRLIAEKVLNGSLPFDADILKIEIPLDATEQTKCVVTRQDRFVYYKPTIQQRTNILGTPAKVSHIPGKGKYSSTDSDAYALAQGWVSITPLSLDLTSRISMDELAGILDVHALKPDRNEDGDNL